MIRKDSTTHAEDERHALWVGVLIVLPLAYLVVWSLGLMPDADRIADAVQAHQEMQNADSH